MSLPSTNFLQVTVSEIQPGQTFYRCPPAHSPIRTPWVKTIPRQPLKAGGNKTVKAPLWLKLICQVTQQNIYMPSVPVNLYRNKEPSERNFLYIIIKMNLFIHLKNLLTVTFKSNMKSTIGMVFIFIQ